MITVTRQEPSDGGVIINATEKYVIKVGKASTLTSAQYQKLKDDLKAWLGGVKIKMEILTIKIFSDGRIVKFIPKNIQNQYKTLFTDISNIGNSYPIQYIYYDKSNNAHNLGQYSYFLIENPNKDVRWSDNLVTDLIDIRTFQQSGFKIHFNSGSQRYYLNPCVLGSLIGACIDVGYTDIDFRGFSKIDGSSGKSKTHYNGYYGDFGYFCKDQSMSSLSLQGEHKHKVEKKDENNNTYYEYYNFGWGDMDEERQNKFNDALYKFGWEDGFWSWQYNGKLLNHSTQYVDHYHHLHLKYSYRCLENNCIEYEN